MTDLPAAARDRLAGALLPPLLSVVRHVGCDGGDTRKTLWRRLRRGAGGERADALPGPGHGLRVQPGRLRDGLPVLRDRPGRADPQPVHRRDRRAGGRRPPGRSGTARSGRPAGCPTWSSWAWASRWPTTPGCSARSAGSPTRRRTGWGCPSARWWSPRSAWCRRSTGWPPRACRSRSRSACTRRTTSCATRWSRSTPAGRWPRCSTRPGRTRLTTGRRVSIEYALIRDVNDQPERATLLGRLLAERLGTARAHVNLIPLNPTPGSEWDASPLPAQRDFVRRLPAAGVSTTVRDTRGPGDRRRLRAARRPRVGSPPRVRAGSSVAPGVLPAEVVADQDEHQDRDGAVEPRRLRGVVVGRHVVEQQEHDRDPAGDARPLADGRVPAPVLRPLVRLGVMGVRVPWGTASARSAMPPILPDPGPPGSPALHGGEQRGGGPGSSVSHGPPPAPVVRAHGAASLRATTRGIAGGVRQDVLMALSTPSRTAPGRPR